MIVVTEPKLADRESLTPRQRFVVHQSTWQTYQTLLRAFEDRPIRLTFDRGELELLSPSGPHERLKKLLDRLITARVPPQDALWHYEHRQPQGIKTVVEFDV